MGIKITGFLVIFLLCAPAVASQQDSLKTALSNATADTTRLNIGIQLTKTYVNSHADSALKYAQQAYQLSKSIGNIEKKANLENILGVIYMNKTMYEKSLRYLSEASKTMSERGDRRGESFVYNNMGSVYFHLKNYPDALMYYSRSLRIKSELGLTKEISSTLINIGNIYMQTEKYDSCFMFYERALNNAVKNKDDYNTILALMDLGEVSLVVKKYPQALMYYNKALKYVSEHNGEKYYIANCYYSIGKIYTEKGQYQLAEEYILKARDLAKDAGVVSLQINIYKHMAKLYEKLGDFENAYQNMQKYHALNDSIFNHENLERINAIKYDYESELKDRQIVELNKNKAIAENNAQRNSIIKNAFIIAFLLVGIICAILYRNAILKQRSNKLLIERQKLIEAHRNEIELKNLSLHKVNTRLYKENMYVRYEILKNRVNPHFLFNSLSTLSNLIITDQPKAIEFVAKFSRLYRDILELDTNSLITLKEELEIVERYLHLQELRFSKNLIVKTAISPELMNHLLPPFSIQLVAENALKHNIISREHPLHISIVSEGKKVYVKNNYQKKTESIDSTGTGQKSIIDRYKAFSPELPEFMIVDNEFISVLPVVDPKDIIVLNPESDAEIPDESLKHDQI